MRRALALLLVVPAVVLGACGGTSDKDSDKDAITKILRDTSQDATTVCDHVTKELLKQLGGEKSCRKAAAGAPKQTHIKVSAVEVRGDKATGKVASKVNSGVDNNQQLDLVKEDGDWKIASPG